MNDNTPRINNPPRNDNTPMVLESDFLEAVALLMRVLRHDIGIHKDIGDFLFEHRGPPPYLWHRVCDKHLKLDNPGARAWHENLP